MPRKSPFDITLSRQERETLESRARKYTLPYFEVLRAKMILLAAEGWSNDEIGSRSLRRPRRGEPVAQALLPGAPAAVWRSDRARGDPRFFPPELVVQIKALACELPATLGLPLSRLSTADIVREAQRSGIVATHQRQDGLALAARGRDSPLAAPLLDLPARSALRRQGRAHPRPVRPAAGRARPLRADEFVISADEKTSIQARIRKHPSLPPRPGVTTAGRARVRARRRLGLPGCARRAPRQGLRPLRAHHRHRALRPPGRRRSWPAALPRRAPRLLDRGQRLLASRPSLRPPPHRPPSPIWSPSTARSTPAGSTRSRSTSPSSSARCSPPTTSPRSQRSRTDCCSSSTTTRHRPRPSSGNSPAMTSTDLDQKAGAAQVRRSCLRRLASYVAKLMNRST